MRLSLRARAAARARSVWPRRTSESKTRRTASQRGKNPSPGCRTVPIGSLSASRNASVATASPTATAATSRVIGLVCHRALRVIERPLLRSGDDAAESVPLLPPGRLELLARLELDIVTELADLLEELLVLGDLLERALELGRDGRRHPFRPDDGAPHREDHVDALFFERRRLGQLANAGGAG